MLGCDPEFALLDAYGNMISCNSVLKKHEPLIGEDGTSSAHAEFRPQPSVDITSFPIQFALGYVRVMQNLIESGGMGEVERVILDPQEGYVDFVADPFFVGGNGKHVDRDPCEACDYAEFDNGWGGLICCDDCDAYQAYQRDDDDGGGPFGGHIHIQKSLMNPKFKNLRFKPDMPDDRGKLRFFSDNGPHKQHENEMILMACLLDAALVEDFEEKILHTEDIKARRNDSYGNKSYGDKVLRDTLTPCIEYRVPSTFLRSPAMTIAYIGIAKYMMLWLRENFYTSSRNKQYATWHKEACKKVRSVKYTDIREQMNLDKLIKFIKTKKGREPKILLESIERCLGHKNIRAGGCLSNWIALFNTVEGTMNKLQRQLKV